jgi:hypothetical protein
MSRDHQFILHRKRPGFDEKVIGDGDLKEVLDQLHDMPSAQQKQCFVMQGGMKWNHLEIESLRKLTR